MFFFLPEILRHDGGQKRQLGFNFSFSTLHAISVLHVCMLAVCVYNSYNFIQPMLVYWWQSKELYCTIHQHIAHHHTANPSDHSGTPPRDLVVWPVKPWPISQYRLYVSVILGLCITYRLISLFLLSLCRPSWKVAQRFLGDKDFLPTLRSFDTRDISEVQMKKLHPYVEELYDRDRMMKVSSVSFFKQKSRSRTGGTFAH